MTARGKRLLRSLAIILVLVVGLPVIVGGCYSSGVTTSVYATGGYPGYGGYGGYGGYYGGYGGYRRPYGYGGGVVITGRPY